MGGLSGRNRNVIFEVLRVRQFPIFLGFLKNTERWWEKIFGDC